MLTVRIQDKEGNIRYERFPDPRAGFVEWYNSTHDDESAAVIQPDERTTSSAIEVKRDA